MSAVSVSSDSREVTAGKNVSEVTYSVSTGGGVHTPTQSVRVVCGGFVGGVEVVVRTLEEVEDVM